MKALQDLRTPLLDVHRALLESARANYEKSHGKMSAGDFLQALITDPQLEWIKPLTTLVASLDELLANEEFEKRYREAMQHDPQLVLAHGKLQAGVRS
jgi:hypothetical protein